VSIKSVLRRSAISFFLLMIPLFCGNSEAGLREQVFETHLSNGLKVILLENHKIPLVSVQVWYRTGSRNEEFGKTGISHLLEHMMFKGTKKVSAEAFTRMIEENGGHENAFTSEDYTGYFENLASDRIGVPLMIESDRMHNLILRASDFQPERMVVMEERRMRTDDNPHAYLMEQVDAAAFQAQPYHWPIVGWMDDIARITLQDLKEYYRSHYSPGNAILVIVGDFRKEKLLPQIKSLFGAIPKGQPPALVHYSDPPQAGERRLTVNRAAQLPAVTMGYHVPNLRDPDGYVLEVISSLLSEGKSSRLYIDLVKEKQLALDVDSDYPLLNIDPGLFTVSAQAAPGKNVSDVEKALEDQLERLTREPVGEKELEKAGNQLEAAFVFQQDSFFSQGLLLARYEIALDWRAADDYVPSVRKVTAEDVLRVAKLYLTPDKRTVGILNALPPEPGKALPSGSPLKENTIKKAENAHDFE
jgi:zinc protease